MNVVILTKNGLGYILGIFSQTHLVTLNVEQAGVPRHIVPSHVLRGS
jgi:hypothetical protein